MVDSIAISSEEPKNEFTSLKKSVKQQISTLSEKETRHHTELKVKVESDLASTKLSTIDTIKKDIATNNSKIHVKLEQLEINHDAYQASQNEKLTTLESTEQLHHQLMIERVTTCDQSLANFEIEFARSVEKAEIQRLKLDDLQKSFEEMSRRMNKLETKMNYQPT